MYYINIQRSGNKILERFIDSNGAEHTRSVQFEPTLYKVTQKQSPFKDIYNRPVEAVEFEGMSEASAWIRKMQDVGLDALGQDNFVVQYASNTYPTDIIYSKDRIRIANVDIEVTAPDFPRPEEAKYPIDALTHYDSISDKLYVFDLLESLDVTVSEWDKELAGKSTEDGGDEVPQHILDRVVYYSFDSEKELLRSYIEFWEKNYPAILTGWNTETFDIPYIINRVKGVLGESWVNRLSPFGKVHEKIIKDPYGDKLSFSIMGVESLDYLVLYKKFSFTSQPTYKLDYISEYETGKGKLAYQGPISKLREDNHQRYISYNIVDVDSVQEIDRVRGFIDLSISIAYYAKVNFEDVLSPIKLWDSIIYNSLRVSNIVIPEKKHHIKQSFPGAFVKEPVARAYKDIISVDAKSLYPMLIIQANISPETITGQFEPHEIEDYINQSAPKPSEIYSCTPNGIMYDKSKPGIIPIEIEKVFHQRSMHKKQMLAAERNYELIKAAIAMK